MYQTLWELGDGREGPPRVRLAGQDPCMGSDQAERGHHTQIIVALIGARAASITTLVGIAFRHPRPPPQPAPAPSPPAATGGTEVASPSPAAQALLDKGPPEWQGS